MSVGRIFAKWAVMVGATAGALVVAACLTDGAPAPTSTHFDAPVVAASTATAPAAGPAHGVDGPAPSSQAPAPTSEPPSLAAPTTPPPDPNVQPAPAAGLEIQGEAAADQYLEVHASCDGAAATQVQVHWTDRVLATTPYTSDGVGLRLPALPPGAQQLTLDCLGEDGAVLATATTPVDVADAGPQDTRLVTYHLATRGDVTADMTEFSQTAASVLTDPRGWAAAPMRFVEVVGEADFTLYMASSDQMRSFGGTCSDSWSCSRGTSVIINQDRWLQASTSWLNAGGSLGDYRTMVINHEVGHYLGLWHEHCPGPGKVAPVMQQQSMRMEGCAPGPWPTAAELAKVG